MYTSSFARFARSATSPSFAYVSNPCRIALCAELLLPNCVCFSCCSPRDCIDPFQLLRAPGLHPLQLLLAACVRFSRCSRLRPLPDCVRFGCCSAIASASTLPHEHPASVTHRLTHGYIFIEFYYFSSPVAMASLAHRTTHKDKQTNVQCS